MNRCYVCTSEQRYRCDMLTTVNVSMVASVRLDSIDCQLTQEQLAGRFDEEMAYVSVEIDLG